MTTLEYFLNHIENTNEKQLYKQHIPNSNCKRCSCGSMPAWTSVLEYLALKVFNVQICQSRFCTKKPEKDLRVLAPLFNSYKNTCLEDTTSFLERKIRFKFNDHNTFQLCLIWLSEIGVKYDVVAGEYEVVTHLNTLDWSDLIYSR